MIIRGREGWGGRVLFSAASYLYSSLSDDFYAFSSSVSFSLVLLFFSIFSIFQREESMAVAACCWPCRKIGCCPQNELVTEA